MTMEIALYLFLGAAAGGFINGLAGFGTSLFALGFFLNVMPPLQAVSVIMLLSVSGGLQGVWLVRRSIMDHPRRLLRFLVPALIGVPLGIGTLSVIDAGTLKLVVAGFLLLYGGYFSMRRALPKFERPTPVINSLIGFGGGLLGGAASLSGALPTMWCSMRPWPKAETRAVLQPFNVTVLSFSAMLLFFKGTYTSQIMLAFIIALPVTMIFAQIGISVFKRMSDDGFRRLLIVMTLLSGTVLIVREMIGG